MTREERRRLLGDVVVQQIRDRVGVAPDPSELVVAEIRRVLSRPAVAAKIPDAQTAA